MVTDTGIIVVSVISIFGMMVFMYLSQYNYFKKKTFLHKLGQQKKIDKLKLSQLRKEMKLNDGHQKETDQDMDLNQIIGNIADKYINKDDDEQEDDMIGNILGTVVENNPELVQKVLGRFTDQQDEERETKFLGEGD
jgi:hypothetical protein